jgi:hypothetical protein
MTMASLQGYLAAALKISARISTTVIHAHHKKNLDTLMYLKI